MGQLWQYKVYSRRNDKINNYKQQQCDQGTPLAPLKNHSGLGEGDYVSKNVKRYESEQLPPPAHDFAEKDVCSVRGKDTKNAHDEDGRDYRPSGRNRQFFGTNLE